VEIDYCCRLRSRLDIISAAPEGANAKGQTSHHDTPVPQFASQRGNFWMISYKRQDCIGVDPDAVSLSGLAGRLSPESSDEDCRLPCVFGCHGLSGTEDHLKNHRTVLLLATTLSSNARTGAPLHCSSVFCLACPGSPARRKSPAKVRRSLT
jgi:hypothetical protein